MLGSVTRGPWLRWLALGSWGLPTGTLMVWIPEQTEGGLRWELFTVWVLEQTEGGSRWELRHSVPCRCLLLFVLFCFLTHLFSGSAFSHKSSGTVEGCPDRRSLGLRVCCRWGEVGLIDGSLVGGARTASPAQPEGPESHPSGGLVMSESAHKEANEGGGIFWY